MKMEEEEEEEEEVRAAKESAWGRAHLI